ncbi:MAG TPA: electron transfer flavoprotein subunit beta [Lentisphaeria bacterium]|nr:MAG: electron transfer flavoprotein subunit beta [Lentisphaerae bacterium GWF2_38_69]HBM16314.1 electron transfer flavoprotein subunit beta [Lentisphaeria bacterium]
MNIVVCIKQVPISSDVEIDPKTGTLKRDGVDSKINPYDLYAIETAMLIKEKTKARVTAITMGPPQAKEILREALMMGIDKVVILSDRKFAGADVLATSYALSQGIRKLNSADIIICGKQTTDGDTAQIGPELAAFLNIPHAAYVSCIREVKEFSITVDCDMDETIQTCRLELPALITVGIEIGQPRLPSFSLKMKTRDRNIDLFSLDDLSDKNEDNYGLNGSPTQVIKIFPPESRSEKTTWEGDAETNASRILSKLNEFKII